MVGQYWARIPGPGFVRYKMIAQFREESDDLFLKLWRQYSAKKKLTTLLQISALIYIQISPSSQIDSRTMKLYTWVLFPPWTVGFFTTRSYTNLIQIIYKSTFEKPKTKRTSVNRSWDNYNSSCHIFKPPNFHQLYSCTKTITAHNVKKLNWKFLLKKFRDFHLRSC